MSGFYLRRSTQGVDLMATSREAMFLGRAYLSATPAIAKDAQVVTVPVEGQWAAQIVRVSDNLDMGFVGRNR